MWNPPTTPSNSVLTLGSQFLAVASVFSLTTVLHVLVGQGNWQDYAAHATCSVVTNKVFFSLCQSLMSSTSTREIMTG